MDRLLLRTAEDCDAAAAARISLEPVSVALEIGLGADEERRLERRLTRLRNACGCHESALALVAGLAVAVRLIRPSGLGQWALALLAVFFVAGVVKLGAVWLHRRAYRRRLRALAERLRAAGSLHSASLAAQRR